MFQKKSTEKGTTNSGNIIQSTATHTVLKDKLLDIVIQHWRDLKSVVTRTASWCCMYHSSGTLSKVMKKYGWDIGSSGLSKINQHFFMTNRAVKISGVWLPKNHVKQSANSNIRVRSCDACFPEFSTTRLRGTRGGVAFLTSQAQTSLWQHQYESKFIVVDFSKKFHKKLTKKSVRRSVSQY